MKFMSLRIILKWILKNVTGRVWSVFCDWKSVECVLLLGIEINCGLLRDGDEPFGVCKTRGITSLVEQLSACQEGPCSSR
jgi:hypothetical protein